MLTYPIMLAHGIARFDKVIDPVFDNDNTADDRTHYFRRIRSTLLAHGFDVIHSNVSWAGSVNQRAADLKANVEAVLQARPGITKVHIIAHSMGGLDARHMLFEHQDAKMHEKVASISTIGTPHWGTSFADWGMRAFGDFLLGFLDSLGINTLDGFRDLTTSACSAFNAQAEAFEQTCGVRFSTFAGTQDLKFIFAPLRFSWRIVNHFEGRNDGLVSLASAKWKDAYFRAPDLRADHLNQLGWWEPNELRRPLLRLAPDEGETRQQLEERIRQFYVDLAQQLASDFPVNS
jgi:triacylglycerol lipase